MEDFVLMIEQQQALNNTNSRFDKEQLLNTINYCLTIARLMLEQVLNKSYYPLVSDEDLELIIALNVKEVVLNVLFPYFKESTFIRSEQRRLQKEVEELEVEHCLLYLRDENNLYNNILRYLHYTFFNII